mgnify:CR=1 FL=1
MLRQIGDIVTRARQREGVTVDKLAQQASVDLTVLRALERGEPGISTAALDRVARQLELDGAALLRGEELLRPRVSVFLRHVGAQDFDHSADAPLDMALEAGRTLRFLNERLGIERGLQSSPDISLHQPTSNPARDGYAAARRVRTLVHNTTGPMGDLRELLEEQFEIAVLTGWLPLKLTAASMRDASGAAAAVLNEHDAERARNPHLARVYLAHELCHVLFDPSEGGLHLVGDVREDYGEQADHVERAEQRARAFAAELLLPLKGLTELLGPPANARGPHTPRRLVAEARRHFSTPWEIAVNHLCNQRFIDVALRPALLEDGPRRSAPGSIETRLPQPGGASLALRDRVRRAYDKNIITDGQARVALGLTVDQPLPWDRRKARA